MKKAGSTVLRIYLGLIPVLLFSLILVIANTGQENCSGLVQVVRDLFIIGLSLVSLVILLIIHAVKLIRNKNYFKHRLIIIAVASLLIFISIKIAYFSNDLFKPPSFISASIYSDHLDIGILELYRNNEYKATFGHVDWSCSFVGSYIVKEDTLFLNDGPTDRSDSIIHNIYIITDSLLIPVKNHNRGGRPEVMEIKN